MKLVDAKHIEQHLDEEKPEGVENEAGGQGDLSYQAGCDARLRAF